MSHTHRPCVLGAGQRARQKGVSLIFALITLVSLMLAAIALVRSVDSGSQVLGNIGFQQDATASTDRVTREATNTLVSWKEAGVDLTVSSAATSVSNSSTGFYATAPANLDATGQLGSPSTHTLVDWDNNNCGGAAAACLYPHSADTTGMSPGSTASYVILRLCETAGPLGTSNCAQPLTSSGGKPSNNGACMAGHCAIAGAAVGQYFRIIVRVTGARSTASYTETIVQY
ncbi:pilus assembly PilX family protein [Aquabacterium sp.]|uniref:pilus assembly PilX family protein n=1 Tax=Aquabacterium sp. TaxID=1872578 RepID=UPI003D6CE567